MIKIIFAVRKVTVSILKIVNKKYEIGDIVFVSKYSYNNLSNGQNHLFVIIDDDKLKAISIEYFGMIVSSHREKSKENSTFEYNEPLNKNVSNGLKCDSIVKCDELYSIPIRNIRFKIGSVDVNDYIRFVSSYSKSLDSYEKVTN